jgi:hypothetical protein
MASPRQDSWTIEQCALFAARRDFELLRLLSTDKKAFTTARRLGGLFSQPHLARTAADVSSSGASSIRPTADASSPVGTHGERAGSARSSRCPSQPSTIVSSAKDVAAVPAPLNARKRRSAKRSARRHRQRRWRSDVLALIFLLRLRRRVRLRRDLVDLEELRDVPTELASKRGRAVREESSSSSSGTGSSSSRSSAFSTRIALRDACEACAEGVEGEVEYCMACARAKGWPEGFAGWADSLELTARSSTRQPRKKSTGVMRSGFLLR